MHSIVLIDDKQSVVDELAAALSAHFPEGGVEIRTWVPTRSDENPKTTFESKLDPNTVLVITDSDLTQGGQTGFFGASVVAWCQQRAIPVGDYSRQVGTLPRAPDLFELRVPADPGQAAAYVAEIFRGFRSIGDRLTNDGGLFERRSSAAVLASLLGRPEVESQLALYAVRLGSASGALMDRVMATTPGDVEPAKDEKRMLLGYIAGHLLLNVLRFPGPILSMDALQGYVACDEADLHGLVGVFGAAKYAGPFAGLDSYFWLAGVDTVLDDLLKALPSTSEYETAGELYRTALEMKLARELRRHACSRCAGKNGGFFCPFTRRAVCQRADCSVGANSWIPQGARVCRIERDFFDEWAPILGF